MKTLITMCILLVCSGCGQVTSNSRVEIEKDKVTIFNEKKANLLLLGIDLDKFRWGEFSLDKGEAIPSDVELEIDPKTGRLKLRGTK